MGKSRWALRGETEFAAARPQIFGFENAGGSNDAGDQFRRGDVEAGVACAASGVRDTHINALAWFRVSGFEFRVPGHAPGAEDFVFVTFLDRDVEAGF